MKVFLPLMKNVFTLLAKIGLVPLGLTTAALETDAAIQKNLFRSGDPRSYFPRVYGTGTTTLIVSYEEMNDITKIVQSLEEFGLLIKDVTKRI